MLGKPAVLWSILGFVISISGVSVQAARVPDGPLEKQKFEDKLFGVNFDYYAQSDFTKTTITKEIEVAKKQYSVSFDPDCLWRNKGEPQCPANPFKEQTDAIEKFSQKITQETGGVFDFKLKKDSKTYRDFGGIAQGWVLEGLARKNNQPWLGNFAGDIFYSGGFTQAPSFVIAHPDLSELPYISGEFKAGWMITSHSASQTRAPASVKAIDKILQITLFAKPEFNGARLDAWATAIAAGGKATLAKLESLKEFKGQWAWVYFDLKRKIHCSKDLGPCNWKPGQTRKVVMSW